MTAPGPPSPPQVGQNHPGLGGCRQRPGPPQLSASHVGLSTSSYFGCDEVALKDFAEYFLLQSPEEWNLPRKLQNRPGGRILLQEVEKPDLPPGRGARAAERAVHLEKSVKQSLLALHQLVANKRDPRFCDFIHYLNEQVRSTEGPGGR
ncbi:Ferritin heavy chain [Sciurus carolinensis]|uniref:Ferritin heavy chain n=1 Tax=Sciurus carolinensis TaxID=30640 RepID=A0AA41MN59_SCICA|nr:Ferritin heavy chain [Sciurus carolinensis]